MYMMKVKEQIWQEIHSFIDEYFPDSYGVMVTGSFVTEYFNETSDIDIIVLSNICRNIFMDTYNYHGIKMQAIVFPVFDLESVIKMDLRFGGGVYIGQIHKGIIIKDKHNIFRDFKIRVESIYIQGPSPISRYVFDQYRARITTRLEDIEGNDSFEENLFTMIDLYPMIINLFFQVNMLWQYTGKSASRYMKKFDAGFHSRLVASFERYLSNNDKTEVVTFIKEFVDGLGGEMHFFSTREIVESCNRDILVVFISSNNVSPQKEYYSQLAEKANDYICKHLDKVLMLSYFYPSRRVYSSGMYLIFYGDKERLNSELLPLIEMFHLDLNNSSYRNLINNFVYPYNNNPLDVFGDIAMQKCIVTIVNNIKRMDFADKEILGFKVLSQLRCIKLLKDIGAWQAFWSFCYKIMENSDNSMYMPKVLVDYYSKNRWEYNLSLYPSFYKRLLEDENNLAHLKDEFLHIEGLYNPDNSYSFSFSKEGLLDNTFLKGNVNLCVFLINLVELILNSIIMDNKAKLFVVFAILYNAESDGKN